MSRKSRALPPSPFRRFNSSPEVIRLVVLMYVRFPLSLRNVEDLLFERGIDICHEGIVRADVPLISYLVRAPRNSPNVPLCSRKFRLVFSLKPSCGCLANVESNQTLVSLTVPSGQI